MIEYKKALNSKLKKKFTGFDFELLRRFDVISRILSCKKAINKEEIKSYCLEIAYLFVKCYPWYYMPTSILIILLHLHQTVNKLDIPIGMLSEEAQESKNKYIKNYCQHHTRKIGR